MPLPQADLSRRSLLGMVASATAVGRAAAQAPAQQDPWPSLAAQIFNERPVQVADDILSIDMPYRAEDAALVPVTLHSVMPPDDKRHIVSITLVIDENPSPLAAVFSLGASSGVTMLDTRVRVDSYTNVHAVAELSDGQLYAAQRFVKAAGGCSAPAAKQEAGGMPPGTMRFRQFAPAADADPDRWEAQLMIRHPNYSGMQMDQLTRLYVPAQFIKSVRIRQGERLLLSIDAGISIAENPSFRFNFRPNGAGIFSAEIEDSEGRLSREEWTVNRT